MYYQDGTDPEIFGRIKLVEQDSDSVIDIDAIVGQKNYTSPNGVAFTNGLVKELTTIKPDFEAIHPIFRYAEGQL